MSKVFTERGACCVWIEMTDEGTLKLSGQDLGGFMGTSEYEYFITVRSEHFRTINTALGEAADADVMASMCAHADEIFTRGESRWLEDLGVDFGFSTHQSFD